MSKMVSTRRLSNFARSLLELIESAGPAGLAAESKDDNTTLPPSSHSTPTLTLDDLPEDILFLIFALLDIDGLVACRQVRGSGNFDIDDYFADLILR